MDTKILEDIGFTKNEIKVYLALLQLGPSSAGKILDKANVQNSVFHFCINRLIEHGFVKYIKKGKSREYSSTDPENILTYLKDKEDSIKKILPELKAKQILVEDKNEAELFKGMHGIHTLMNTLISGSNKGDEFIFFSADVFQKNDEISKFYKMFDLKRDEKGLISRGISPNNLHHKQIFSERKSINMRYIDFPVPANTIVCSDMVALIAWEETPIAVLVKSKQLAKKQKEFFDAMWKIAKD